MFIRDEGISSENTRMLKLMTMLFAAVLVMLLAMTTSAQAFSVTGKVVGIDTHKRTISVAAYFGPDDALSYAGGADRITVFALKHDGKVMKGSESRHFSDIRLGDWVTVTYYETGGGLIEAGAIALTTPPAGYPGGTALMFSLPGRVVAIDSDGRTLTIDPSYYYGPSYPDKSVRIFATDRNIVVMTGSEPRDFRDLRVGDWVSVNFHQDINGLVVADSIAITAPPAPYAAETARTFSIPGKVVAIDRDSRIFTLDPSYCYGTNYSHREGLRIFALDRGTVIMMGSEPRDFRDLRVGDWVSVSFHHESRGLLVADGIAFTSPSVMMCSEKLG